MQQVTVRELKTNPSALLRRVRDARETIEITHRGKPVARIVPINSPTGPADAAAWLTDLDTLAARIGETMHGESTGETERG